jgi:1-deoxy-D-xylulose-5-phosphate reductoisomerase
MLPDDRDPIPGTNSVKNIAILGSTGSIGTQCLEIARLHPDRLRVRALTGGRNVALLVEQSLEFRPDLVVIADESKFGELREALGGRGIRLASGPEGLLEAATLEAADTIVAAIVGYAGLESTLAAVKCGKQIALANKETLVVAGHLVRQEAMRAGAVIIPIDSEHSAIFQCLVGEPEGSVEKLLITASGGPFRTLAIEEFGDITTARALNHPNWSMGAKITIDSATMMNKGLEVIEARWMFNLPEESIQVVVHPESVVHSMVLFVDGSTKAQVGVPDMRVPIQYALSYPQRWRAGHPRIDWAQQSVLHFEPPDTERFPCLRLAYEALKLGGTAPTILNAANEVAVARFLSGQIAFTGIPGIIEKSVNVLATEEEDLEALREADIMARSLAEEHSWVTAH